MSEPNDTIHAAVRRIAGSHWAGNVYALPIVEAPGSALGGELRYPVPVREYLVADESAPPMAFMPTGRIKLNLSAEIKTWWGEVLGVAVGTDYRRLGFSIIGREWRDR